MHFGPPQGLGYRVNAVSDLANLADLIVVGSITELYIGEMWREADDESPRPKPYVKVAITEILKGEPVSRVDGFVEVMFGIAPDNFDAIAAQPLPEGEYLWFLLHNATERERLGAPPRDSEIAPYAYYPPAGRGVLLNDDGQVAILLAERLAGAYGDDFFPLPLAGHNFDDIVGQVRDLIE